MKPYRLTRRGRIATVLLFVTVLAGANYVVEHVAGASSDAKQWAEVSNYLPSCKPGTHLAIDVDRHLRSHSVTVNAWCASHGPYHFRHFDNQ